MSALVAPIPRRKPPAIASGVQTKRWTVDEFHDLSEGGWFEPNRAILIDGEIIEMPQAKHPHDMGVTACTAELNKIFESHSFWVRVQMALPLGLHTDPGPDLAVAAGAWRTHTKQPKTALLVIEVSDSTLAIDTREKVGLYAAGQIADYWVLDLSAQQLIVFRDPVADSSIATGFRYATKLTLEPADTISPLAAPQAVIRVADLLP